MLVRLNQPGQLLAKRQTSLAQVLGPFAEAVESSPYDLKNTRVLFDWVQYKHSFRDTFQPRRFVDDWGKPRAGQGEIAIDLRQVEPECFADAFLAAVRTLAEPGENESRLYLEEFRPGAESVIWAWNLFFWQHLVQWEQTFSGDYTNALPGGESDGMNPDYVHDQVSNFVVQLDELAKHNLVPDEIFVLEMGVGNGLQSKRWMDEFRKQSKDGGKPYYDRLRYIMSDFSQHILDHARPRVLEHIDKVSLIPMNALDPESALGFLRYKVLYAHLCNVYDNLPCTEIARFDGRFYEVELRAYLEQALVAGLCEEFSIQPADLPREIERLLRIGPDYFPSLEAGVNFWAQFWRGMRLEERYVPIPDLASYPIADRTTGEDIMGLLEEFPGDVRFHLSNGAVKSFVHTIPLLHPKGLFEVQDIFTTSLDQYRHSFRGPGKFDGSLANWVNGPLLRHVAGRHGFNVEFTPFRYRKGSQTVILTTSMKE
ncbi:MAG TPA: hypothetical protein VK009_07045 [Chloroflexota bacterium]|nr:hypothetical protein [Chloroflexota bacterium]